MSYYQGLNLLGLPTRGKPEFNLLYTILLLKKKERNGLAKATDLTNYGKETQTARDKDLGLIIFAHTIGNSKRYR